MNGELRLFTLALDFDFEFGLTQLSGAATSPTSSSSDDSPIDGLTQSSPATWAEFDRRCNLQVGDDSCLKPCPVPRVGPDIGVRQMASQRQGGAGLTNLMRADSDRFWQSSAQARGESEAVTFTWQCSDQAVLTEISAGAVDVLARGCCTALMEVFRRYPGAKQPDQLSAWFASARGLSRCFDRIGIWPLLADQIASSAELQRDISAMAEYLDGDIGSEYRANLGDKPGAQNQLHFVHWVLNLEDVEFHRFAAPDEFPDTGHLPQLAAIVADLESLPVPAGVTACRTEDGSDGSYSLNAVLRALLGSPGPDRLGEEAQELMLFAACCHASAEYRLLQGSPWFSWHRPWSFDGDAQHRAVEGLVKTAISWLAQSLPGYAFSPKIEQDILKASI